MKEKGTSFPGNPTSTVTSIRIDSMYSTYRATLARVHLLSGEITTQLYSDNEFLRFSFCWHITSVALLTRLPFI